MNERYRILIRDTVLRDIRKWPRVVVEHLRSRILQLAENPFPPDFEKMQGYDHVYRIRAGKYRILYRVEKDVLIITVIKIGHRKDIYRQL